MEKNPWEIVKKYRYALSLIGIGIFVYWNSLFGGYVWDDIVFIVQNSDVHSFHFLTLVGHNVFNSASFFRPIAALYFAAIYTVFQGNTFPFHFLQVSLHIINAILLMLFFRKFFSKTISWCLALLFLVHPIQVESVSYISTMDDPMFFFFGIMGLLLITKKHTTKRSTIMSALFFVLTLLTKETGIFFLLFANIYLFFYERKKILTSLGISLGSICVYILMRLISIGFAFSSFGSAPIDSISLSERFYTMPAIFLYYLKTFFFPNTLAVDQQWIIKTISFSSFIIPLCLSFLFLLFLASIGMYMYKMKKKEINDFIFFSIWFFSSVTLLLQIIPLDMTVADRWFYLSLAGLLGIGGCIYRFIEKKIQRYQVAPVAVFLTLICMLSLRTMIRNTNWSDPLTLYTHDAVYTQSYDLESNLAVELEKEGAHKEALYHAYTSVQLFPGDINQNNLAVLYEHAGNFAMAKKYFSKSFAPQNAQAHENRHHPNAYIDYASFLAARGSPQEAVVFINQGLQEYPKLVGLLMYLAIAKFRLHEYDAASRIIETAYEEYPSSEVLYVRQQIQKRLPIEIIDTYDNKPIELY